jgi:hypothetical protein
LPAGNPNGIVHVRVLPEPLQYGDVALMSLSSGVPPFALIATDDALGETKSVRRVAAVAVAAAVAFPMTSMTAPCTCGPDGAAAVAGIAFELVEELPPEHPARSAIAHRIATAGMDFIKQRVPA